jgi:beta-N-acetylhexosaminidase
MTLQARLGQLVMIDFTGLELTSDLADYLATYGWGSVILFAKNVADRAQVARLCEQIQGAAVRGGAPLPVMVSIDQEGGIVNRLTFADTPVSPGPMALGAIDDPDLARQAARWMAQDLASLGILHDCAPCVDVNSNPRNPIIGVRSYGESPQRVAALGRAAAQGLREGGVIPCAKHFPGHGNTAVDSHTALPTVLASRAELDGCELVPFRALIEAGLESIMTAHIVYPALDPTPGVPATLSKPILTDLLRGELGFDGVICTDSMAMHAIARNFGTGEAAVRAIEAGADIVMACGPREAHLETLAALTAAVESGRLTEERIKASVERVLALKRRYLLQARPAPPGPEALEGMRALARRAITQVADPKSHLPLRAGSRVLVVAPTRLPTSMLGELDVPLPLAALLSARGLQASECTYSLQDETLDTGAYLEAAAGVDAVICCLFARHGLPPAQLELSRALAAGSVPVISVAVNSPYIVRDLPWVEAYLCTYGYPRATLEALADVLSGRVEPVGVAPVTLF